MNKLPRTSDLNRQLFGDLDKYVLIMDEWKQKLTKKYPDRELARIFATLPTHGLTVGPMALCDSLSGDLGTVVDKEILAAIGLSCLLISTHDDVVDEMPRDRITVSRLIFAGNIASMEGTRLLFLKNKQDVAQIIIDAVNQNHYLQQKGVEKLWLGKKISKSIYINAISHTGILTSIGALCAIVIAGRNDLKRRILKFSKGYGTAIQIIDDLREMEEDKLSGYMSLPLLEGPPFTQSRKELFHYIEMARNALNKDWKSMHTFVDRIEVIGKLLEKKF